MYSLIQLKTLVSCGRDPARSLPLRRGFLLIPLILACFAFLPKMQAQEGDLGGGNTNEGFHALFNLTTGGFNTGLGWYSLGFNLTDGFFNTAVGAGSLDLNNGTSNTAAGTGAMLLNITANNNTAVGTDALLFNDFTATSPSTANDNTALGFQALFNNHDAGFNTAVGSARCSSMTRPEPYPRLPSSTALSATMRSFLTLTDSATTLLASPRFSLMISPLKTPPWVMSRSRLMTSA